MERVVFEIILEQREEEQKAGRNVATLQCRNVSAISVSPSLKAKGTRNRGGSKILTDEGTESREQ